MKINEIEHKTLKKIFFEKIKKVDKVIGRVIILKRAKIQRSNIRNERGTSLKTQEETKIWVAQSLLQIN